MEQTEKERFDELYQRHLRLLKLQGMAQKTIDSYSRAVRRITEFFDCCPDQLTLEQREEYFSALVEFYSWSHVLPKGFRRVRDYGFLNGNAKRMLYLVKLILHVVITIIEKRPRPVFRCSRCHTAMVILGFRQPAWKSG